MRWLKYGVAGIFAIVVLGVIVLLLMGRRSDAGRLQSSIVINRPPAVLWAWLEEPNKFAQWVSWTIEVKDVGPNGLGGRRTTLMKDPNMGGRVVEVNSVLMEYERPRRMTVDMSSPIGFHGRMTYDLEDLGEGRTRLVMDGRFVYHHWFANLIEPLVTPQAKAKSDSDLRTLKQLAEK
jgi:uncharacterized protein YndB with AHSA1/START domain